MRTYTFYDIEYLASEYLDKFKPGTSESKPSVYGFTEWLRARESFLEQRAKLEKYYEP
jgi:hypothetical protein